MLHRYILVLKKKNSSNKNTTNSSKEETKANSSPSTDTGGTTPPLVETGETDLASMESSGRSIPLFNPFLSSTPTFRHTNSSQMELVLTKEAIILDRTLRLDESNLLDISGNGNQDRTPLEGNIPAVENLVFERATTSQE